MIAAPAVLCALLAQALPPAPPPPPRPPERLHIPRVHVPRIEIPEFDVDLDDWDFPGVDLSGLRVVDVSALAPGPFCTQILVDFGADVIWVEPIEPPPFDVASFFAAGIRSNTAP